MRIEFITQDDPLYILPFFEEFLRAYADEFEVVRLSCSPTMGKRSRVKMLKELTTLYGPAGMARLLATTFTAKLLSRLRRDRASSTFYGLSQICAAYGIAFENIGSPNEPEFLAGLKQRNADVLVSVACPFILKTEALTIPRLGCVNIHHAPLPRYKGMMPTFWQMFHGEESLGVTVHFMSAKLDEGNALLQERLEISKEESLHSVIQRAKRHGAHAMARALRALDADSYTPLPLDGEPGTYFTFPTRDQIREFHRRGYRAI